MCYLRPKIERMKSLLTINQEKLKQWKKEHPKLQKIMDLQPITWINPNKKPIDEITGLEVSKKDMLEAESLWNRFAPYFEKAFPETKKTNGIIESPLKELKDMKIKLSEKYNQDLPGDFYLKCDNELPITGSIKSRGGVYEILSYAEKLATEAGLISKKDSYEKFTETSFKDLFSKYTIGVGSTGNLALSVGIISAKLGFTVNVYMSEDAKAWKKNLLREEGVTVHEFSGDFSRAIHAGRKETDANPFGYFVDDEDSKKLFLGYSVAGLRLEKQLIEKDITVDEKHPLFVYLPCGVGGSPGGVAFGLKQIFGDNVHCFFVEPTHSPSVLLGLLTGEKENISVQDFGIDNKTEADGLAVGRPSKFATGISENYISGVYTIEDNELFRLLATLIDEEDISLEPSATTGLIGPWQKEIESYAKNNNINWEQATHIAWATGGALVPEAEMDAFYQKGVSLS